MTLLVVFAASYVSVLAKSMQQLNVVNYRWAMVPMFSYLMAFMEYSALGIGIGDIIANGYGRIVVLGLSAGTGGWLGSWSGMWAHRRI